MKRRDFIKISMILGGAILLPTWTYSKELSLDDIQFSKGINTNNQAQTILVFQYGGASQLCGNLTNLEEFSRLSQRDYVSYFGQITKTKNNCWSEAGGKHIETLLEDRDMTLFRSCHSFVREKMDNKAHASCVEQNQCGSFTQNNTGIITNIAKILEDNGIVNEDSIMPFVSLEGDSSFYLEGSTPLNSYLKAVALDENLDNPYARYSRDYRYYTDKEESIPNYKHAKKGFDASLYSSMDDLAQQQNKHQRIKEFFDKRSDLDIFIKELSSAKTPDLGKSSYPKDSRFSQKLETAIKILAHNSDTKVISIGTGELGGWDDHNKAQEYVERSENLFATLKSAMAHIKALGKEQNINIMVFGDFGRNVNLNASKGWDHGNLQNFYVLGGHAYFKHKGIVGETILEGTGTNNRLYLKPKPNTYTFEPISIASTLYKIYGIENPETLTDKHTVISPLFT
jgi:hypothetical protein